MKNLKHFMTWWLQRMGQKAADHVPNLLGHFLAVANIVSCGAMILIAIIFAAVTVQAWAHDLSPRTIYEILATWSVAPVGFILANYFRKQWVEWRDDQARLLTTLGKK